MSEILGTLFKYLVSLLGVAAVVLILYQVFGSNKTQTAISDLTLLQANTQALYSGQSTFTGLTNAVAIAAKLATSSMSSSGALINPWGGTVTIAANSAPSKFDITTTLVPSDACAKIAVGLGSVVNLGVGATGVTNVPLPADAGDAATKCAVAANNTMIMTFNH